MEQLIEQVKALVDEEYRRASAKFGETNHSDHESYAVLLEEFEEAKEEIELCESAISGFWKVVKDKHRGNQEKILCLQALRRCAILAACEVIQVCAMATKAENTIMKGEEQC